MMTDDNFAAIVGQKERNYLVLLCLAVLACVVAVLLRM